MYVYMYIFIYTSHGITINDIPIYEVFMLCLTNYNTMY